MFSPKVWSQSLESVVHNHRIYSTTSSLGFDFQAIKETDSRYSCCSKERAICNLETKLDETRERTITMKKRQGLLTSLFNVKAIMSYISEYNWITSTTMSLFSGSV